jgi:CheY-like chemotaxis protein
MAQHGRRVVLIVEDEVLIRLAAIDTFNDFGFAVLDAEHSAAAILISAETPHIDLLFTDVNMPGEINGISLAEHLFALRPLLKIIVTSALPLLRQVDHLNARFLPKPYETDALSSMSGDLMAA